MKVFKQLFGGGAARLALSTLFLASAAGNASAGHILRLSADGGGTWTTIVDEGAGDLLTGGATGAGTILFSGTVGAFSVSVTTGTSKPITGTAAAPELDLASLDVSGGAGTLLIQHTDTGFTAQGPGIGGFTLLSLPLGGSAEYQTYWDAGGGEFATTSLITDQGPFSTLVADTAVGAGPTTSGYSLTQVVTLTHAGVGTSQLTASLTVVPEPSTVALAGISLLLLGMAVFRLGATPLRDVAS